MIHVDQKSYKVIIIFNISGFFLKITNTMPSYHALQITAHAEQSKVYLVF